LVSLVRGAAAGRWVVTIKRTLGLPPDMAALQVVGAACELMDVVPLTGATLPQMAEQVCVALGMDGSAVLEAGAAEPVATAAAT